MKRLLLVAVVAGLAILFWQGRDRLVEAPVSSARQVAEQPLASQPLLSMPLAGAPLTVTQPTLLALARQGDRAAATRLESELHQCMQATDFAKSFKGLTLDEWMAQPMVATGRTPDELASTRAQVAYNMGYAEQRKVLCGGTQAMVDSPAIFEAWWLAARMGDDDATACLLFPPRSPATTTAAERMAYDTETMQLAQRGLAAGNWHVVSGLKSVYAYSGMEGQVGPVSRLDPRQHLRLIWLEHFARQEENRDAKLEQIIPLVQERMTAEEASAAEQDARQLFDRSFRGIPPPPESEGNCVAPGMSQG